MKRLRILIFCICFFSVAGGAAAQSYEKVPPPCASFMKTQRGGNKFRLFTKTKNIFKKMFGMRQTIYCPFPPACISDLVLSQTEVLESCPLPKKTTNFCPENKQSIQISSTAWNPVNDVLTYDYKVSAGEIIGKGRDRIWDLSGVKPGTYTITACVDNGVGCLNTITKEVKVVGCPDCK